jgi:hypothetical protein
LRTELIPAFHRLSTGGRWSFSGNPHEKILSQYNGIA